MQDCNSLYSPLPLASFPLHSCEAHPRCVLRFFFETGSLCCPRTQLRPVCPQTLRDPRPSVSEVLSLKTCATTPALFLYDAKQSQCIDKPHLLIQSPAGGHLSDL